MFLLRAWVDPKHMPPGTSHNELREVSGEQILAWAQNWDLKILTAGTCAREANFTRPQSIIYFDIKGRNCAVR
jgi:hypothetical protein